MDTRETLYYRLMAEHGAAVARVAGGFTRDRSEREDLEQDIWFAVWRALPSFRGDASLKTFVLRIAHNRAISSMAARRRRAALEDAEALADTQPAPEAVATREQEAARLLEAVRRLPIGLRQAVTLRLEGMSHAEIAAVLGITENNVAVRLNRARDRLRTLMQEDDHER